MDNTFVKIKAASQRLTIFKETPFHFNQVNALSPFLYTAQFVNDILPPFPEKRSNEKNSSLNLFYQDQSDFSISNVLKISPFLISFVLNVVLDPIFL